MEKLPLQRGMVLGLAALIHEVGRNAKLPHCGLKKIIKFHGGCADK
jgi:hypothetical protein